MYDTISLTTDARGVATLSLNRPDQHNAMSATMISELTQVAAQTAQDDAIRVVVLTGMGKSFCAGADLRWMQDQIAASASTRADAARHLATMLMAMNALPKPLIGRINGPAFGGGIGLMSVCDVAIGAEEAKFALTETRLGLIPATIGPYVIARIGGAKARRVFMSGRRFDAAEAVDLGLLAKSAPAAAMDDAVEAEVTPYLSCAPGAVAEAKALALSLGENPGQEAIDQSVAALVHRWDSAEAAEGIAAFFDKRKPGWAA